MSGVNILCADAILLREDRGKREVLLVKRAHEPNKGMWAIPGGKVEFDEDPFVAAWRELQEETGLVGSPESLIPMAVERETFNGRCHQILTYLFAYVGGDPVASDESTDVGWFDIINLPLDTVEVHYMTLLPLGF